MHVATNILVVGALVFVAHAFTGIFSRTRVPDVLLLTIIGILLGPVFHLVTPANFGAVGPVFAAITLVIILFEAGLSLDFDVMRGAIRPTLTLTLTNFFKEKIRQRQRQGGPDGAAHYIEIEAEPGLEEDDHQSNGREHRSDRPEVRRSHEVKNGPEQNPNDRQEQDVGHAGAAENAREGMRYENQGSN